MSTPTRATILRGLTAAAAAIAVPRPARAQGTTVRLSGVFSDPFAEPFYAAQAGAFAHAGFQIETITLNNASAVAAAIGAGSLDLGTGDLISGVNAINAGVPIVLVAGGGLYNEKVDGGTTVIAVAADSPMRTPKDLVGKSIGVPTLVGLAAVCLRTWLPQHGIPMSAVKLVEMVPSTALGAIQRGTLDATLISEPYVTFAKSTIRVLGSPFDAAADLAPNKTFLASVWYANKSWFTADAVRSRAVLQAIYDTARWSNTHRDDTFNILVTSGKLDAEKAHGMQRTTFATNLTPELIQPVLTVGTQNQIFAKPVDAVTLITKP